MTEKEKRVKRTFYRAGTGIEVEGLSCGPEYEGAWYVPSEGATLWHGTHLFNTRLEALKRGRENCRKVLVDTQKSLAQIERQIEEEERK
jgi:hypothetical protein